ncbi:RNA polymerase sigma factor region1.1 domain-containing protein, partial [Bartonella sp. AA83SXKL]
MATKVKQKDNTEVTTQASVDSPLLDFSDDAIKKMVKIAKKNGYVTMDELNAVLPPDEVTSEQIEDTLAMFSEMGINVVDDEGEAENYEEEVRVEGGDLVEA